jgi:AAA domain/AAA domain, putative AbiEii toxin, Type IV TA system
MVDSITIRNFRSFNDVTIDGCRRINIIVGDNGSGKTSLLEALFLVAGVSPELAVRTRFWRGSAGGQVTGSQEDIYLALWGDLFHKFHTNKLGLISLKGTGDQNRSVTIQLNRRGAIQVLAASRDRPGAPPKVVPELSPMEFRWKIQSAMPVVVKPMIRDGKIEFPPAPDTHIKATFFAANQTPSGAEMAAQFSQLSRSFEERKFIEKFQSLYPAVLDISIELDAGSPVLFAKVASLPQKIPLGVASGGMNKLAAILLAIPIQSGGVVLIDEIENGFYYDRMQMIWEALLDFVNEFKCQIFASTHLDFG